MAAPRQRAVAAAARRGAGAACVSGLVLLLVLAGGAHAMSACNAFAKIGAPCGDYASVCCGGLGPGGPAACVGERIQQLPVPGKPPGFFNVKWTPGTCVPPPAGAAPVAPAPGSFCTRWVGEGGACTFSGAAAPPGGMVCCDPGLKRGYRPGEGVGVAVCGQRQAAGGEWVPAGCQVQAAP